MFNSRRLIIAASAMALLAGCASPNPYENQGQGSTGLSKTATYGGLGALAGAVAGAAIDHNNRGKGALIGAAVAGLGAAGYGYYADKQEAALRASMANTGVQVERQGDNITLVMPGNITFATNSANIASSFYQPLSALATSLKQLNNQQQIQVVGYTDNTGSYAYNMQLSQQRAQSVADYLMSQGVSSQYLTVKGMGPADPIASNATPDGRAMNRRVQITLAPIPGMNYQQPGTVQQYP